MYANIISISQKVDTVKYYETQADVNAGTPYKTVDTVVGWVMNLIRLADADINEFGISKALADFCTANPTAVIAQADQSFAEVGSQWQDVCTIKMSTGDIFEIEQGFYRWLTGQSYQRTLNSLETLIPATADQALFYDCISRTLATPPANPVNLDKYIIPAGAAGAWANKADYIARYFNQWEYYAPHDGWLIWCAEEGETLIYRNNAWQVFAAVGPQGPAGPSGIPIVLSVAGKTGDVVLAISDIQNLTTSLADKLDVNGTAYNSSRLNGYSDTHFLAATAQAVDSLNLGGHPVSYFLAATAQAVDSAKLNGQSASYYLNTSLINAANGVAGLGSDGKIPTSLLPASVLGNLSYQGAWDQTQPLPEASTANKGWYYVVSVAGNGSNIGDWVVSNGFSWDKIDNTDAVTSVAGRQGAVTLTVSDIGGLQTSLDGKLGVSTQAADSALLQGHNAAYFLAATAQAVDSAKLGGQLPSYYLSTTGVAADSSKLGGQLPSYYLAATAQAVDSVRLGGNLPSYYATAAHNHDTTYLALTSVSTVPGAGRVPQADGTGKLDKGFVPSFAIRTPFRWFYETPMTVNDLQPVFRVESASTLKAIRWFRNATATVTGTTTIAIYKNSNGTALYTVTIPNNAASKTWVDAFSGLNVALAAGDYLEAVVTAGNATLDRLTLQLDVEQAIY